MTSSLRYQVRRVSSSFWTLRGRLTSRRPHTAMYNDGPARRVSVSVFAKPTSSMKRSASRAFSTSDLFKCFRPRRGLLINTWILSWGIRPRAGSPAEHLGGGGRLYAAVRYAHYLGKESHNRRPVLSLFSSARK